MSKNVTILNFSPRNNGNCTQISMYIINYYAETNVRVYNIINETFGTCNSCNYECLKPGMECPSATQFQKEVMNTICASDLVYYIVPNFCGHPCANYYAFNERSVGYFNSNRDLMNRYMSVAKRFIIISNTENETFKTAMQQQVMNEPDMLFLKTGKYKKKSIAGDILDSDQAVADLNAFLNHAAI